MNKKLIIILSAIFVLFVNYAPIAVAGELILASQTIAGNSKAVRSKSHESPTFIIYAAAGIDAATDFSIQISHDGCITWQDAGVNLSVTNVAETAYGVGCFRVVNPGGLTNATEIRVSYDGNI